jgi:hypothetical protein
MEWNVLVKHSPTVIGSFIFKKFIQNGYVLTTHSFHGPSPDHGAQSHGQSRSFRLLT